MVHKRLSELIPSLEPTLSPIEVNIDKVGMSTFDLTTRRKARLILEKGINFEASDEQIMAINIHSKEDVDHAVTLIKNGNPDWIKFYDGRSFCANNFENYQRKYIK